MAKSSAKTTKKTAKKPAAKRATTTAKKSAKKKAAPKSDSPKTDSPKSETATIDRRRGDRRADNKPVAVERRNLERRVKTPRRRQIDPTTCERDYSNEEIEFMSALDEYKRKNGRMFPTCSEVLEVIRDLGYRKHTEPTNDPMPANDAMPASEQSLPEIEVEDFTADAFSGNLN